MGQEAENKPFGAMGQIRTDFWTADYSAPIGAPRRAGHYKLFIPAPIATYEFGFTSEAASAIADAERQLEQLRNRKRGPSLKLARSLLRSESAASSRIEGLAASQTELARAAYERSHGGTRLRRADEVLGNVEAMEKAVDIGSSPAPITPGDVLAIHKALLRFTADAGFAGSFRDEQNWIGGNDYNPIGATYVGPPPEEVPGLMSDLCAFINRDDLPAVAQAAVAHAQFENIHPFADGNGRTGRALIYVVLRRRGSIEEDMPPISLVFGARSRNYIAGIAGYREGRVSDWCREFAQATADAASRTEGLAVALGSLQEDFKAKLGKVRRDSAASQIIGLLPEYPILDLRTMMQATGKSKEAVGKALNRLEAVGVITPLSDNAKRNRVWECSDLLELLDALDRELAIARTSALLTPGTV